MIARWSVRLFVVSALVAYAGAAPAAEAIKLEHVATLYAGEDKVPLRVPQGVACAGDGTFLVADSGNARILRFEVSGALAMVKSTLALPELPYPIAVAVDPAGNLVVLDGKSRRLARVKADGTFGGFIEVPAAPSARAASIRSFAVDPDGRIFALDAAGRRVVVLSAAGAVERTIAIPAEAGMLLDVALDARGGLYAVDGTGRRVFAARAGDAALAPLSGSLAQDLDFPGSLTVDSSGRILVADENGGGIVILGADGSFRGRQSAFGWRDAYLRYPADLCADRHGMLAVADRENQRVQVFRIGN